MGEIIAENVYTGMHQTGKFFRRLACRANCCNNFCMTVLHNFFQYNFTCLAVPLSEASLALLRYLKLCMGSGLTLCLFLDFFFNLTQSEGECVIFFQEKQGSDPGFHKLPPFHLLPSGFHFNARKRVYAVS